MRYLACVILMTLAAASWAAERPRHNPFADLRQTPQETIGVADTGAINMVLRAVMTGGRQDMANINGRILVVGDRYNGYELIAVGERHATLRSARGLVELKLKNTSEDANAN